MAGSNGKQKTVRDMILSLGVIMIAAAVIYVFIPHDDKEPDLQRVDYRIELVTARRAASYPVAAPEGLPESWKPTSVRFNGADSDAWHLGFHAPDGEYVTIEQSTGKPAEFIDEASQGARETEAVEKIDGRTWTHYTGGRYEALVLKGDDGSTTVVAGTGSYGQLLTMVKALKMA